MMNDNDYHGFETASYTILLENLAAYGLDRRALHWVKNWMAEPTEGWD